MQIGQNIKAQREKLSISQENLAEQIYVSRQTISNWENNKSYPDLHSLLLLSKTFGITIDTLIKGDIATMKQTIQKDEISRFNKLSILLTIAYITIIISAIPLVQYLGMTGFIIWLVICGVGIYISVLVEKEKKKFDIQTYKEILAFSEGRTLDEIVKEREKGKRPYQKLLLALRSAILAGTISILYIKFFI